MSSPSNDSLSSLSSIVLGSRKGIMPSNNLLAENPFGAAATLGLGVGILRWLISSLRHRNLAEGDSDSEEVIVVREGVMDAVLSSIRRALRRLLLDADELAQYESINPIDEAHVVDGALISHQGSCHCSSVRFEIRAPRTLIAKEGPGKINYRHTDIKSSNLRVMRGANHLKTYYVKVKDDRGAHAFCDRCGCHILYAPSRDAKRLMINTHCIDEGIRKIKVVDTNSSLSHGSNLESQWDDQLTTISEISQDMHFSIKATPFHADSSLSVDESMSTDFKLYDDVDRLDPSSQRTLTTVDSFTAHPSDTQSLPALRIPRNHYSDAASIMTDDAFSVSHSEYGLGGASPTKSLAQMKKYMTKHATPSPNKEENAEETRSRKQMASNAGEVVASLLNFS